MHDFSIQEPNTVAEAASLLPERRDDRSAVLLAGGQDLLTEMRTAVAEPERVINLKKIPGLDGIEWGADGSLTLGALVTLQSLAEDERVQRELTVLAEAAGEVGSPQIRSVGTVGGNLNQRPRCWYYRNPETVCLKKGGAICQAQVGMNKYNAILGGGPTYIVHPSDLAPALVALGAEVTLEGKDGRRSMLIADYYLLPADDGITKETVREADEVLTHVRIPAPAPGMQSTWAKFRERGSYDWALSAVALCLWRDDEGTITNARIALGGVAPTPWRCASTEQLIAGRVIDPETCRIAGEDALKQAEPLAENGYKVPLTKGLLTRAMQKLAT